MSAFNVAMWVKADQARLKLIDANDPFRPALMIPLLRCTTCLPMCRRETKKFYVLPRWAGCSEFGQGNDMSP